MINSDILSLAINDIRQGNSDEAVGRLHQVIEQGGAVGFESVSLAYMYLGHICRLLSPQLDGGYNGIGFYSLAIMHNRHNCEAQASLIQALSDDTPTGIYSDTLLNDMLQRNDEVNR